MDSFPFMQLPKELRLLIYEYLAFSTQHLILHTGTGQIHPCRENAPPVSHTLGTVTLVIPSVPGVPLLRTSRLIAHEASPSLAPALRKCIRTPPRLILAYSDLSIIINSPFWSMLQRTLQTLICRRRFAMEPLPVQQRRSTLKICAQHHIPCVIKAPRAQTKVAAQELRKLDAAQLAGYLRFVEHARKHYQFLQDVGVRKSDVERVELVVLLKGDALRTYDWAVGFHERCLGTEMLRVQFAALEEEVAGCETEAQAGARIAGILKLAANLARNMGARGWWPSLRNPFRGDMGAEEWDREWAEG